MPEHVAEHGDADPLCEPLPARLEGPALRRHREQKGQPDAAQHEGVIPGWQFNKLEKLPKNRPKFLQNDS